MNIVITTANKVYLNSGYKSLKVDNADEFILGNTTLSDYKYLLCYAKKGIFLNGFNKGESFDIEGTGVGRYTIRATEIKIN